MQNGTCFPQTDGLFGFPGNDMDALFLQHFDERAQSIDRFYQVKVNQSHFPSLLN